MSVEERIARLWEQCLTYRDGDREAAAAMFSAALDLAARMQRKAAA